MKRNHAIGLFMNIVCGFIICLVMGLIVLHRVGAPMTLVTVMFTTIESFFVSYMVGDLVPSFTWGNKFAAAIGLKGVPAYFIAIAVHDLFMVTLISFLATFMVSGFTMKTIIGWWANYPVVLLCAYLVLLLIMKPLMKVAMKITENITD
ncbi:MAG TPA: hypothetical protein DEP23_05435 [Ruminococcaceae bacterium]|jgi:hypothetical protein|nr:hypothetical protein [Oscillospiraceae bacterium]